LAAAATRTLLLLATAAQATQIGQVSQPPVVARCGAGDRVRRLAFGGRYKYLGRQIWAWRRRRRRRRAARRTQRPPLVSSRSGVERRWRRCGRARRGVALYTPSLSPRRRERGGGSEAGEAESTRRRDQLLLLGDEVEGLGGGEAGRPCAGSMRRGGLGPACTEVAAATPGDGPTRRPQLPTAALVDREQVRRCEPRFHRRRDGLRPPSCLDGPDPLARAGPVTSRVQERLWLFFTAQWRGENWPVLRIQPKQEEVEIIYPFRISKEIQLYNRTKIRLTITDPKSD